MIEFGRFFRCVLFVILFPLAAFADAPVIDDNENFALLEDQQMELSSDARTNSEQRSTSDDEIRPLAHDTTENNTANNADLLNKLQGLQQDMQALRGELDTQSHQLKALQEQQLAFYKDLDTRITGTNNATAKVTPASLPPSETVPTALDSLSTGAPRGNPADEQISYFAAYDLVKNKHFDDAIPAMQQFITRYPQGGYTANAHYWLGELYIAKKEYAHALEQFGIVEKAFPTSNKVAASTLKMGYALAALGKTNEAKERLQYVIKTYPDTPTARLASAKLTSIPTM